MAFAIPSRQMQEDDHLKKEETGPDKYTKTIEIIIEIIHIHNAY